MCRVDCAYPDMRPDSPEAALAMEIATSRGGHGIGSSQKALIEAMEKSLPGGLGRGSISLSAH